MKIEEKMNQIVTVPEIADLFRGYTLGLTTISLLFIGFAFIPPHTGSVIPIVMFLFLLGNTFCKKVVIDKNSESIIVTKRHFMLFRRKTMIPFSDIVGMSKEFRTYGGGPAYSDAYEVNIITKCMNMAKIRIYRKSDEFAASRTKKWL